MKLINFSCAQLKLTQNGKRCMWVRQSLVSIRMNESVEKVNFTQHHRECPEEAHGNGRKRRCVILLLNLWQKYEKCQAKSNNQDGKYEKNFDKSLQNFQEHHHIDSNLVETLQIEQQVQPSQEDRNWRSREENWSQISIHPRGRDHDEDWDIQHPCNQVCWFEKILISLLVDLRYFSNQSQYDVDCYKNSRYKHRPTHFNSFTIDGKNSWMRVVIHCRIDEKFTDVQLQRCRDTLLVRHQKRWIDCDECKKNAVYQEIC